jgi:hypothetical protein
MPATRRRGTEKSKREQSIPDGCLFDLLHTPQCGTQIPFNNKPLGGTGCEELIQSVKSNKRRAGNH